MIIKRLITATALLAFTTVSGAAFAGAQPSDQRWWPTQTQSATVVGGEQAMASAVRITPQATSPSKHQYRGGPRSIH